MKCSKQYMYACNKATKLLGMIKRTIRFKDMRVRLMLCLYKSGVYWKILIWGNGFRDPGPSNGGACAPAHGV